MKKLYIILSFSCVSIIGNATIHTINVADFQFSPNSVNAVCGDTIEWVLSSGHHTTTSATIPNCAAAWSSPINVFIPTYNIVVACPGTYNYKSSVDVSMTGTIVVTGATGTTSINNNYFSTSYPNPFSSKLTIETFGADMISLYNAVGEKIKTILLQHGQTKMEIDMTDYTDGIYFYSILKEGIVIETRKVIRN